MMTQPYPAKSEMFGDFIDGRQTQEYLIIGFSPTSIPLKQRWRNSGLSADFLADYVSTFFPSEDDDSGDKQAEIKDAVSYVANELLENAMKFSYDASKHPVGIGLHLEQDVVRFYVTNCVNPSQLNGFEYFIQEILSEDPDDLYLRQLEKNAAEENESDSGLGFLTMINDYDAKLAWKFETVQEVPQLESEVGQLESEVGKLVSVTTMVQLTI
jgi:hypothetical protein